MKMTAKYIFPRLLSAAFAALLGFLYFVLADALQPKLYSDGRPIGLTLFDGYAWAAIILFIPAWGWGAMNTLFWLKSGKHRQAMKVLAAFTFMALVGTSVWLGCYFGREGIIGVVLPNVLMLPIYLVFFVGFLSFFAGLPPRENLSELPPHDPWESAYTYDYNDPGYRP